MSSLRKKGPIVLVGAANHLFKTAKLPKKHRDVYIEKADIILKTMGKLNYQAINVGQYDLALGVDYLKKKQKKYNLPLLSANLTDRTGTRIFPSSKLVTVQGIKLGIIGIIRHRLKRKKIPGGNFLRVLSPIKVAKSEADKLRKEGASIVIVLTDMDDMESRMLTKREISVDVIISSCRRNRISLPSIQNKKIILHLNRYGENVGCLQIFRVGKKAAPKIIMGGATVFFKGYLYKASIVPLGHLVKDDEEIAKWVDTFVKEHPYAR